MKKLFLLFGTTLVIAIVTAATVRYGRVNSTSVSNELPADQESNQIAETSIDSGEIVDVSAMSAADVQLAKQQGYCPVTLLKFINMNVGGIRVQVRGRDVLVANSWAKGKLLESPNEYLEILDRWEEAQTFNQTISDALSGLSEEDQILAKKQTICVVDNSLLGLRGVPQKLVIPTFRINLKSLLEPRTETVFVCCEKCKTKVLEKPEKYFDLMEEKRRLADSRRNLSPIQIAEIEKSFSLLSAENRAIAEKQLICPVTEIRLGTSGLGAPVRVDVDGAVVMICCAGCRKNLVEDPKRYLDKLRRYHMVTAGLSMPISDLNALPPKPSCTELPVVPLPKLDLPQMELPK